ncbi:MAG TPA: glycosyltransferase [Rhodanobacteraceae bacterium]|nr:glycosyltransferase [Rhodanobacteraceae bacterium]
MNLVVFGLTITSSWGNGHATLWRGMCKALAQLGVEVTFFERDVSYYAQHRDCVAPEGAALVLYDSWPAVREQARRALRDADAAIVTSYCPDALSAHAAILDAARPVAVFYDLDSPITIAAAREGHALPYLDPDGLRDYDVVLSYAGGPTLHALQKILHARNAHPLYGHVDPALHRPVPPAAVYRSELCWLGTYAADRQRALQALFVDAARARPRARFTLAGAQYPSDFPWRDNIWFIRHLPPSAHAAFLCSARLALNVTRDAMARAGWCPSGRLFETAACAVPIVSDDWAGLAEFYRPGAEILLARDTADILAAMDLSDAELKRIGNAGRERTLASHTSMHRARELVQLLEASTRPLARTAPSFRANAIQVGAS